MTKPQTTTQVSHARDMEIAHILREYSYQIGANPQVAEMFSIIAEHIEGHAVKRIADNWTVQENGFSCTTGRPLANILDCCGRIVASNVLKEDAELIVEAVNAKD